MQNALLMIGLQHPGRAELKDIDFQLFEKYKDYLLGDFCYGLRSNEASGALAPPWTLVLSYENAIRKQAYKQMVLKGIGFADALVQSWKDAATIGAPVYYAAKRPQPWSWDNNKPDKPGKKGKGKAKARISTRRRRPPRIPSTARRITSPFVSVSILKGAVRKGLSVILSMSAQSVVASTRL